MSTSPPVEQPIVFSEYKNTTFIIFELINYNTRIKIPLDKFKGLTTKLTFIYKNKYVYEPILFRNNTKKYYSSIEKTSTNKYINDIIDNVVELCNYRQGSFGDSCLS